MTLQEITCGQLVPDKKNAVFVAVLCGCKIYEHYEDPTMSPEMKEAVYPFVLMMNRWDGRTGFIGGIIEKDVSILDQLAAEMKEEAGMAIDANHLVPMIAHQTDKIAVHLYRANLGIVTHEFMKSVLASASQAQHAVSEGCVTWIHLADYSYPKFIKSENFATAVREELEAVHSFVFTPVPAPSAL